jgi:hypothetical protein
MVLGLLLLGACLAQLPGSGAAQRPESWARRVLALGPALLPSPCTSGRTYCELAELPAAYPHQHVLRLASKARRKSQAAAPVPLAARNVTDAAITRFLVLSRLPGSLPAVSAHYTAGEEEPLCLSQVHFVRPGAALNTDLQWRWVTGWASILARFVLNMDARNGSRMLTYQQVRPGPPAGPDGAGGAGGGVPGRGGALRHPLRGPGHRLQAEVHPTQVLSFSRCGDHPGGRLLALSEAGEEYTDTFLFPSCCLCHALPPPLPYWRDRD